MRRGFSLACSVIAILPVLFLAGASMGAGQKAAPAKAPARAKNRVPETGPLSDESKPCVACHTQKTPGIVAQWKDSKHGAQGISCWECHNAEAKDPGAWKHEGSTIVTAVSPKACVPCHGDIVEEFERSHHASAAKFIGSLDN
ncbi:MAG TPA: multiheme c-type cytochrome, partial [Thermoanaerobaculia bacterium]|nr:multiheme c-type cytochrome [Thermoanaerobaculia bacterium]